MRAEDTTLPVSYTRPLNSSLLSACCIAILLACTGCSSGGGNNFSGSCGGTGVNGDCNGRDEPTADNPKPCPNGQTLIAGRCATPAGDCPVGQHPEGNSCAVDQLDVEGMQQSACTVERNGVTQVLVQYIARDESGRALNAEVGLDSTLWVDDAPVDVESLIAENSELLESDLVLSLVLDASYSMLRHEPPAFGPMLESAAAILDDAETRSRSDGAEFDWRVLWFNEYIQTPLPDRMGTAWSTDDVLQIPPPEPGTLTGLYKAVAYMAERHLELYGDGRAAGTRDQHIMLVLSDGADNHSFFDNSSHTATDQLETGLQWQVLGYQPTNLADLDAALAAVPNLRVHVIGVGDNVNDEELRSIAAAGGGLYFFDRDTGNLADLFASVREQFVTLQILGAQIPLQPGRHTLSVRSAMPEGGEGRTSFELDTGDLVNCVD